MFRRKFVTKETAKKAYREKFKKDEDWKSYEGSIHNDLDTFFSNLQGRKKIKNKLGYSFFTPKLTQQNLKLVEEMNEQHVSTYSYHVNGDNPDVDTDEMKKSDSCAKFVQGYCGRLTTSLTLE